ncbi:MAG: ABC transporter permease, partial [Phycisphaeraceae bacterium]|nr:ABC transporter permease [Phycisphaeraceae bacterium]
MEDSSAEHHHRRGLLGRLAGSRTVRNIQLGVKTLMLHKLRSGLTMLGMVFGVGSVIAMLAVGEGASAAALAEIRKLGSHNIIVNSVKPAAEDNADGGSQRISAYGLYYADERRLRKTIPTVKRSVPARHLRKEGRLGETVMQMRVVGTTPTWFELVRRKVIAGRVFTEMDVTKNAAVVVLTEHGARRLLATEETIGQPLRIGNTVFEVIGIVSSETGRAGTIDTPDQPTDAYLPLDVARSRYGEIQIYRS